MDLLALCLAATCVLHVNAYKVKTKIDFFPSTLDIACKQLTPSTCPAHANSTRWCPRDMDAKGGAGRNARFKIMLRKGLHKERKTWHEALKACQSEGGTLSMPKTKEKQRLMKKLMTIGGGLWLGLRNDSRINILQWIDGSKLTYTNWCKKRGQPKPSDGMCVCYTNSLIAWNDGWFNWNCTDKLAFLCQY